jgi:hypothetical protein
MKIEVIKMRLDELKSWYEKNHLSEDQFDVAVEFLTGIDCFLETYFQTDLDHIGITELDEVVSFMVISNLNQVMHFVILMRYYKMLNHHENFIRLTQYTGGYGVVDSILEKLTSVAGKSVTEALLKDIELPVLGTNPSLITTFTKTFITWLEDHLEESQLRQVLACNHHRIPKEALIEERVFYEASPTLEIYLKDLHDRKVNELEAFQKEGKIWYEQTITPEVVQFVKNNQEIMSAVLKDDALYITKIPYDTKKFLEAKTTADENYYLCHCPFAREVIKKKNETISANWCYCSGGFTKFPFDIIFDQSLEIELLSSALKGDGLCRFKIDLTGIDYKK